MIISNRQSRGRNADAATICGHSSDSDHGEDVCNHAMHGTRWDSKGVHCMGCGQQPEWCFLGKRIQVRSTTRGLITGLCVSHGPTGDVDVMTDDGVRRRINNGYRTEISLVHSTNSEGG